MKIILTQALANAADGAFITDEDQHITFWNRAAEEILGYRYEEISSLPCYEVLDGRDDKDRPICHQHCPVAATALAGGAVTNFDARVRIKMGGARWINVSTFTAPANDETAGPAIVHLFRDATQNKQHEQLIYQVLEAAENLQGKVFPPAIPAGSAEEPGSDLTDRERQILSLLAQALSTHNIAESLSISPATTRNHIRNILQKLHVHSRLEAVIYAFRHGLVNGD